MSLVLSNANVVDVEAGTVGRGLAVVLDGDRIAALTTDPPSSAQTVDVAGGYLVPGFNDMHAHPLELADPSGAHQLMLAFGITGYRQMSGSAALLTKRRAGVFADGPDAPTPLLLPGALLSPLNAGDADRVRATIRAQHGQGADFVKMGMVDGAVYPAAQDEANRLGIPLGGHLPPTTMAEDAAAAGISFIEHLGPGLGLLASCAADPQAIRDALAAVPGLRLPSLRLPFIDRLFAVLLARIVVNPQLRTAPAMVAVMRTALDGYSDERAAALAEVLAAHRTWQCPTLIREKTNECGDDPDWAAQDELRFVSAKTRTLWDATAGKARALPAENRAVFHDLYAAQRRLTAVLADAGVPMLAGSDVTGASWEVPGASLHREFDELAAAGLGPLQVLRATTSAAARFAGRADLGAVQPGRRADLVLLGEDPTRSVAALHDVVGVIRHGRYRDAAELAAIKDRLARTRTAA
ncbi:MAG: amidohydrolase family protein [Micropruina sp.]|uniref:amidohydrolase family protein n=1 Tax=Micropruina sp. TaxID=2737536 RepID=UPI0039E5AFD7